jgi:hypothetical protein
MIVGFLLAQHLQLRLFANMFSSASCKHVSSLLVPVNLQIFLLKTVPRMEHWGVGPGKNEQIIQRCWPH